jgi:hypothetical protein
MKSNPVIRMAIAVSTTFAPILGVDSQPSHGSIIVVSAPQIVSQHASSPYSLLDAFTLESQPLGRIAERIQGAIQGCMKRDGWNYWNPTHILFNNEYSTLKDFWSFRSKDGYGVSEQILDESQHRQMPSDTNFAYLATLTLPEQSRYWLALTGASDQRDSYIQVPLTIPSGRSRGCEASARRKVLRSLPYFQMNIRTSILKLYSEQNGSGIVAKGTLEWKGCMQWAGYRVKWFDQEEASFLRVESRLTPAAAKGELSIEKAAAVADARCFLHYLYPAELKIDKRLLRQFAEKHSEYRIPILRAIKSASF